MSQSTPQRLYRSRSDRMISGVSGGLADYFAIDPVLVRLLWVLAAILSGGTAVIAYVALWIIVPPEGYAGSPTDATRANVSEIRAEAERVAQGIRQTVSGEPTAAQHPNHEPAQAGEPGAPASPPPGEAESETPYARPYTAEITPDTTHRRRNWAGIMLILIGAVVLASNLGLFWWFSWSRAWPVVLIAIGVLLLWNRARE